MLSVCLSIITLLHMDVLVRFLCRLYKACSQWFQFRYSYKQNVAFSQPYSYLLFECVFHFKNKTLLDYRDCKTVINFFIFIWQSYSIILNVCDMERYGINGINNFRLFNLFKLSSHSLSSHSLKIQNSHRYWIFSLLQPSELASLSNSR